MRLYLLIIFVCTSLLSFGQLQGKLKKMIGEWEYRNGSGVEVWKQDNDKLHGYEYRLSKFGDTVKVEEMIIQTVNNKLIYSIEEHRHHSTSDTTKCHENMKFIADKRKMKFFNIDENTPHYIQYSFGFLNKNKLKVKIQYGQNDKPVKLTLIRVKLESEQL